MRNVKLRLPTLITVGLVILGASIERAQGSSCKSPGIESLPPLEGQIASPTLKVYTPETDRAKSQVVLVPPIVGENALDRRLARALCDRGIQVLILTYRSAVETLSLDLGVHDRSTEEFLAQLEQTLRARPRATILVGASLGGLLSSVAYGLALKHGEVPGYSLSFKANAITRWVEGAVLTVAGGPLPEILATSQLDHVVKQRTMRIDNTHATIAEYEESLRRAVHLDTVALAEPTRASRVLFFKGLRDSSVPTATQQKLEAAWGGPEGSSYRLGHRETIVWVYQTQADRIAQFVKR